MASVASLFVSRWDTAVAGRVPAELRDRLGIAVAKQAYRAYRELLDSPRWGRLANEGARAQRLLWASTSVKDPEAPDVLYVEALAVPFTVDTMPDHTLEAFADHGTLGDLLPADGGDADQVIAAFARAGDRRRPWPRTAAPGSRRVRGLVARPAGPDRRPARAALPVSTEHTLITEPDASSLAGQGTRPASARRPGSGDRPFRRARRPRPSHLPGAIFDVDGVLVDSPHYRAWREALQELMDTEWADLRGRTSYSPERFTEAVYQQVVAGKPRLAGALAALEYFGVPDAGRRAERYAAVKQEHLVKLIEAGDFTAFPDAIRFVLAVKAAGIPIAAASSSKNADLLLRQVSLDTYVAEKGLTLLDLLDADVSGRDLPRGKPDPMIFLVAAEELPATPARCFVVEDAAVGVRAAKAGGMAALAVARLGDEQALADAGADLVVRTLDEVSRPALAQGRLARKTEG